MNGPRPFKAPFVAKATFDRVDAVGVLSVGLVIDDVLTMDGTDVGRGLHVQVKDNDAVAALFSGEGLLVDAAFGVGCSVPGIAVAGRLT